MSKLQFENTIIDNIEIKIKKQPKVEIDHLDHFCVIKITKLHLTGVGRNEAEAIDDLYRHISCYGHKLIIENARNNKYDEINAVKFRQYFEVNYA